MTPGWLDTAGMHGYVQGREVSSDPDSTRAASRYAALVEAGKEVRLWDQALRQQIYLGDEEFVDRMQAFASATSPDRTEVPKAQRAAPAALRSDFSTLVANGLPRDAALYRA